MRKGSIVIKGWIWAILFSVCVLFVLRFMFLNLAGEGLFGFKLVKISGPSMQDTLPDQAYVVCKVMAEDDIVTEGKIYGYVLPSNVTVMHRVIGRQGDLYVFKGDNNQSVDSQAVPKSAIRYKYLFILYGGNSL